MLKERLRRVPERGARYLQQTLWRGFNPPAPADWEPQLYGLSESNRIDNFPGVLRLHRRPSWGVPLDGRAIR